MPITAVQVEQRGPLRGAALPVEGQATPETIGRAWGQLLLRCGGVPAAAPTGMPGAGGELSCPWLELTTMSAYFSPASPPARSNANSPASLAAAVRVGSGPGALVAEFVAREGAESAASAWSGFARVSVSVEGQASWFGRNATLTSPAIPVAGPTGLVLYFWTRHGGSLFAPAQYGRAEVSGDNGATWSVVYEAQGAAASWYPVAASLPLPPGATNLRVRFVSNQMDWWVDAIAVAASSSTLFAAPAVAQAPAIAVSQNPLRSGTVTLRWPAAAAGNARVEIFSLLGTPVVSVDAGPDVGLWRWDGTILRSQQQAGGPQVANGAYLVVVTRGDGQRLRRRLVVAR